jgi:hypothetical protein
MKNILDKINRADEIQANLELDKTELGTHEVELANINDLIKLTSLTEKSLVGFNRQYKETIAFAKSTLVNADEFQNNKARMYDLMQVLEKQAKELGIDIRNTNEFKKAINLLTNDRDVEQAKGYLRQIIK